jgi:hypothetical protein
MLSNANVIIETGRIDGSIDHNTDPIKDDRMQTEKLNFFLFSTLFSWGLNRTDPALTLPS